MGMGMATTKGILRDGLLAVDPSNLGTNYLKTRIRWNEGLMV